MFKITTRLILSFVLVSGLPLLAVSYIGLQALDRISTTTASESTAALKQLGEESIHQQALHVAQQMELYLEAHPDLSPLAPDKLQADKKLASIAVQPVGRTGYTAVYNSAGMVFFHSNPEMVNRDMHDLANSLPAFWAILAPSLDGTVATGYYDWGDANGIIRAKYMSCVPVGKTLLRVAATTYIDEFYQPIQAIQAKIALISQDTQVGLLTALIIVGLFAVGLALGLANGIAHPLRHLTAAAEALERGNYDPECLVAETSRRDDLGHLSRVFDRMAQQVKAREEILRRQVEALRIEIDETKKARQVAEITETEYFRSLREKARQLREKKDE